MRYRIPALLFCLLPLAAAADLHVVIVQGLGGTAEYTQRFDEQTAKLQQALATTTATGNISVFAAQSATRDKLLAHFRTLGERTGEADRIGVFLIGHGSYDGYQFKFNLPGPDITGEDLVAMLDPLPSKHQLLVNTSSTSGAVLKSLTSDRRVVITATRSGNERNATRFGHFFTDALDNPAADTDKNNSISVQESFDYAARMVEDSFESEGQLATEHPQLAGDDAARFVLSRFSRARREAVTDPDPAGVDDEPVVLSPFDRARRESVADPELARLLKLRDRLEGEIEELQLNREQYGARDYMTRLQTLLIELAELEERIEQGGGERMYAD